ncbi:MAG: tetratricopeptide repeat protein, partial [Bacteroidetes bacterium]|nr:tetratricopeptide repeat protein [Bacteroidota bacterium]
MDSYIGLLDAFEMQGHFDSALTISLESVAYFRKINQPLYHAYSLYDKAIAYRYLGQFENAFDALEECRGVFERIGNKQREGNIYNLLQLLASDMHQYDKAVAYGLKAVAFLEESKDIETLCYSYNNLGMNYINVQSYDSSKYYLGKAYKIAMDQDLIRVKITYHLNMGYIALRQNNDSLRYYAQKALDLAVKNHMAEYEMLALWGLSSHYLIRKDYANTKLFVDSCRQIAERYQLRQQKQRLYPLLSNYYFAVQNSKLGNYYAQQSELLRDSMLNESIAKNTIDIEKKYET